jgi:nitrile hydratase accessory protein
VFDAPWQARAHAMAVLLVESTHGEWADFRRHLVDAIGAAPDRPYWESWVDALQRFVARAGLA